MVIVKIKIAIFSNFFLKGNHMSLKDRIQSICKSKGLTSKEVELQLGFGKGYISKIDKTNPTTANIKKIADYLGVSVDYIMRDPEEKSPELTARDEKDITKTLNKVMEQFENNENGPLYYDGEEIDETSRILIRNAFEYIIRETKKENKVKYNPNKNKTEK